MITQTCIQQVKKFSNISVDAEKTKERFERLWKTSSPSAKNTLQELADVGRNTIYRVYETGVISARLLTAASQVTNVNPYYIIGETDEDNGSSDEIMTKFLHQHGYPNFKMESDILTERQRTSKTKAKKGSKSEPTIKEDTPTITIVEEEPTMKITMKENINGKADNIPISQIKPVIPSFLTDFDESKVILLIRGIIIRAEEGVPSAIKQVEELGKILLS